MAGELLFQIVDFKRLREIRPILYEIDAGRALSQTALDLVSETIPLAQATDGLADHRFDDLKRISRSRARPLRWFFSPGNVDGAVETMLRAQCFDGGGRWALSPISGSTWAVIEWAWFELETQPTLSRTIFGVPNAAKPLDYPNRGETRWLAVERTDLPAISQELAETLAGADLQARAEVEGLARLIERALAKPDHGLAFMSLL